MCKEFHTLYHNVIPFFLSAIKEWNGLEHCLTNAPSLTIFKNKLMKRSKIEPLPLNNNIPRYSQIVIAQLRIGFSDLNSHLFNKGCAESPLWLCGNVYKDTKHFLMICPLYDNKRTTLLLTSIQQLNLHVLINHKLLLYGNTRLTPDTKPFNTGTPVCILNWI